MSRPDAPDAGDSGAGSFLGRWSRRKREAGKEPAPPPETAAPPAEASPAAGDTAAPAAELPLPSLDDIVPGADVSAFFQSHVPEALRTAALRKLWVTDPTIKDFIEMADYQWDFTNPDAIPGWSSSVGDFDVGKLVERIMGGASPKKIASDALDIVSDQPDDRDADLSESVDAHASDSTDNDLDSSTSQTIANAAEPHVALQNNGEESEVYAPARKRHGGALPS